VKQEFSVPSRDISETTRRTVEPVTERDGDERVSLAPLDPETALRALLAVKPDKDEPSGEDDDESDDEGR